MKKFILISAIILLIGAGKSFAYSLGENLLYANCPYGYMNWQPAGSPLTLPNLTATLWANSVCVRIGNVTVGAQRANGTWEILSNTNLGNNTGAQCQKFETWTGTWVKCELQMSSPPIPNNPQGMVFGMLQIQGM